MNSDQPLTIKDANCLMAILENDIPQWERNRIAFLLLVLASNPSLAKNYDAITDKRRQHYYNYDDLYAEYY